MQAYLQKCYIHVTTPMSWLDAKDICQGGHLPLFTKHNMAEAWDVWKAAGTNDGLWTGTRYEGINYKKFPKSKYIHTCFEYDLILHLGKDMFAWAQNEPNGGQHTYLSTYIFGSNESVKLYDDPSDPEHLHQFVCMKYLKVPRNLTTTPSTSEQNSNSHIDQKTEAHTTEASNSSSDLTWVWVIIALLVLACVAITAITLTRTAVGKKWQARLLNKDQSTEKTARPMTAKHASQSADSNQQPQMQRRLMGRLHSNEDTVSDTSHVQSEGRGAVLGRYSATASASGVHIDPVYDVHLITANDQNRAPWNEAIDGPAAVSNSTSTTPSNTPARTPSKKKKRAAESEEMTFPGP